MKKTYMCRNIKIALFLNLFSIVHLCAMDIDSTLQENSVASRRLTLQECLIYAKDNSRSNLQNQLSYQQARIQLQNQALAFLPYISASVGGNISFGRGLDPETNSYATKQTLGTNYGISASLPLFDGLVNINTYKLYRSYLNQNKTSGEIYADDISLRVIRAFYNTIYYSQLMMQVNEQLKIDKENLRKTVSQEELGLKSGSDVDQMQSTVAEGEYSLVNQQNQFILAQLELKAAMSWPLNEDLEVNGELESPMSDNVFTYTFNLHELPKATLARESLRQGKLNLKIAHGNWFPSITLSAGVSTSYYKTLNMNTQADPFHRQFSNNMGEYISTGISFPIFGRLGKYNNVRQAKLSYKMRQAAYDETMFNLEKEMIEVVMNLEGARKEFLAAVTQLSAVTNSHRANQRKYDLGNISALELQTSSIRLSQARATLIGKQIQFIIQKRQYDYYNGKPYIK